MPKPPAPPKQQVRAYERQRVAAPPPPAAPSRMPLAARQAVTVDGMGARSHEFSSMAASAVAARSEPRPYPVNGCPGRSML